MQGLFVVFTTTFFVLHPQLIVAFVLLRLLIWQVNHLPLLMLALIHLHLYSSGYLKSLHLLDLKTYYDITYLLPWHPTLLLIHLWPLQLWRNFDEFYLKFIVRQCWKGRQAFIWGEAGTTKLALLFWLLSGGVERVGGNKAMGKEDAAHGCQWPSKHQLICARQGCEAGFWVAAADSDGTTADPVG